MAEELVLDVKTNIKSAAVDTKEFAKSLERVTDQINDTNRYIIAQERELIKLKNAEDAIPKGAFWYGRSKNNQLIKETTARIKLSKNAVKGLKEEQKFATNETKEFTAAQKDQDKAVEDSIGSFKLFGVSLKGVKKSFGKIIPTAKVMFGTLKAGLISTGIGALLVAFGSLVAFFKSSKKGADTLKVAMAGLGAGVRVITDLFAKGGEAIVGAFENPKQAISDLWEAIKKNLINRLTGMVDAFKGAMKIIGAAIKLDWEGAKEGAKEYGQALVQVGTGLDVEQQKKFVDGVKKVVDEIKEEVAVMTDLERRLHRLRDAENEFLVTKAKTRLAVAEAKMDSKDETKTLEERRAALQSALDMQQATTDKELELAREKMNIQKQQMATSTNMAEDEQKLAQLQADLYDKEASSLLQQKRLKSEMNTFDKEIAAEKQAIIDADNERIEKEKEDAEELRLKREEEAIALLELQQENALAEIDILREKLLEELRMEEEKQMRSVEGMENAEKMKAAIKKKYDRLRIKANKKADKEEEKSDKALKDMKIAFAQQALSAIASIAGEGTKIAKAAAVVQATISGTQATLEAFKSGSANIPMMTLTYGTYGFIQAALAATFAALQIKNILAAKPPDAGGGGGGGGGMMGGGTPAAEPPAPQMMSGAFELGGGQEVEPMQAYVVSDDITASQNGLEIIRRRATI